MIIYLHVPGFYAAVEQADNPALRGTPVIVGGDPRKRGNVTSASVEAQAAQVVAGMPLREALERCPTASLRPTRLQRYREVAQELRAILSSASPSLESDTVDGTYLEAAVGENPLGLAAQLCVRVQGELGLTPVAGIGATRFVAYVAARHAGRAGLREVPAEASRSFLAGFPVTELWGLGPATARKLAEQGIERIGDLQELVPEALEAIVGRHAAEFRALARAEDRGRLRPSPRPKSLSQERTLDEPTVDLRTLGDLLQELARRLEATLLRERRAARSVSLTAHYVDEHRITKSESAEEPLRSAAEIRAVALELLARTHAGVRAVRRLRLRLSNLCAIEPRDEARQLRLL